MQAACLLAWLIPVAGTGRVGRVACWACRVGSGFLACRGVLRIQRSVLAVSVPFRVAACVLDGPCRVGGAPEKPVLF